MYDGELRRDQSMPITFDVLYSKCCCNVLEVNWIVMYYAFASFKTAHVLFLCTCTVLLLTNFTWNNHTDLEQFMLFVISLYTWQFDIRFSVLFSLMFHTHFHDLRNSILSAYIACSIFRIFSVSFVCIKHFLVKYSDKN